MSSLVIPTELTGADQIIYDPQAPGGVAQFYGWSIREAAVTAAAATVIIHAGTDATGMPLGEIELAADGSDTEWLDGVQAVGGIFVEIVTGTVEGSVFWS